MNIKRSYQYAVDAYLCILALQEDGVPVSGRTIATVNGVSVDYLNALLAPLKAAKLVQSSRGTKGGYTTIDAENVNVGDLVRAMMKLDKDVKTEVLPTLVKSVRVALKDAEASYVEALSEIKVMDLLAASSRKAKKALKAVA